MVLGKKYKCKVEGCSYETDDPHAIGGHTKAHTKKSKLPKEPKTLLTSKARRTLLLLPPLEVTPDSVATALLNRVVKALRVHDGLVAEVSELKGWKSKVKELEAELAKVVEEKDRIVRLHNEQVESKKFTSGEELIRLARLKS